MNSYQKPRKKKFKCKWVTKAVRKFRRAKIRAWNKYIKFGKKEALYNIYKRKLNKSVKANRDAKKQYETKLANNIKNDSKSFFAYVRSTERNKVTVGPLKDNVGNIITDDKITADIFNDYFASVFTIEDANSIPVPEQFFTGDICDYLSDICIDENVIYRKLSDIKVNKCPGSNELHPKLLYELRDQLVKPLTTLYQTSLLTGIVPQDWREARVAPLFKKGKRDKPENYRPVSLTSIVGKLFESIVKDNIVEHLDRHSLIKGSQHGFTKGRSCLTNLLSFIETVTLKVDEGNPVDIVYLDFAKAFDKVPYQRLFKMLEAHGVSGPVLNWIKNWLSSRRQKVCVSNENSDWRPVISGVP